MFSGIEVFKKKLVLVGTLQRLFLNFLRCIQNGNDKLILNLYMREIF